MGALWSRPFSRVLAHQITGGCGWETVSFMGTAVRMYESIGFVRRTPYYQIPDVFLPVTIFMEKNLEES